MILRSLGLEVSPHPVVRGSNRGLTPDYKVRKDGELVLYCEVKSVLTETHPEFGLLWQTLYNSLTADVHKAAKQFQAVNPDRTVPNVLIWMSHNFQINVNSFVDLAQGKIQIDNIEIADLGRYTRGRFQQDIDNIDMVIWIGPGGSDDMTFVMLTQIAERQATLQHLFASIF